MRFQYSDCPEQEEVRRDAPKADRNTSPGHEVDPGGGRDEEMEKGEVDKTKKRDSRGLGGDEWSQEVQDNEVRETELDVDEEPDPANVRVNLSSISCEEEQPFPALAPKAFFCLKQTTRPRYWCIRIVCNPYPFTTLEKYLWRVVRCHNACSHSGNSHLQCVRRLRRL